MNPVRIPFQTLDRQAQLVLELVEILPPPPYRGRIGLAIVVLNAVLTTTQFQVRRRFNVAAIALEQFAAEVRALEHSRTGTVQLTDEDCDAFSMALSAADGAGHLTLSVDLKWGRALEDDQWEQQLSVAEASIDPSSLPRVADAARRLWSGIVAAHG